MKGNPKRILMVDDEKKITEAVSSYLMHNGYEAFVAHNGKQALELFETMEPALVILDLMLPDVTGEEICRKIRRSSRVPIIMLTAKVDEESILQGFNMGADDYVTKPFSPKQLMARVSAVLRRTEQDPIPLFKHISFNNEDLMIDSVKHEVRKNHSMVNVTPNEYNILMTMVKYPKKTFTREEIIQMAMGEDFDGFDRTVDTHIKNLRQKIETDPKAPQYIETVHGVGYRFAGESRQ